MKSAVQHHCCWGICGINRLQQWLAECRLHKSSKQHHCGQWITTSSTASVLKRTRTRSPYNAFAVGVDFLMDWWYMLSNYNWPTTERSNWTLNKYQDFSAGKQPSSHFERFNRKIHLKTLGEGNQQLIDAGSLGKSYSNFHKVQPLSSLCNTHCTAICSSVHSFKNVLWYRQH